MERDDRDMQESNDAGASSTEPHDGPSREEGRDLDPGATSQDQPGGDS